jgi:hypothetical protein
VTVVEVCQHFTAASQWDELVLMQIHPQRLQVGPILHRSFDSSGKASRVEVPTDWAPHLLHLMFLHDQAHGWQVMHLATFLDLTGNCLQRLLAVHTPGRTMRDNRVWLGH